MKIFLKISFIVLAVALAVTIGVHQSNAEDDKPLSGKVIETMDSGGYTYVQIEDKEGKTWVAVPKTKVVKGQDISFAPGAEMKNFESKSLKRTFDTIIFSGGVIVKGEKAGEKVSEKESPGSKGSAVVVTEKIKVDKAAGPDAYTVAEIFEHSKDLEGKKVVVRGKAVKVSEAIMSKNWVHLQDGSGDKITGNYDLVLTSKDLPKNGDIVIVSGVLSNNKDFGGGYKYKVIIENADVKKDEAAAKTEDPAVKK